MTFNAEEYAAWILFAFVVFMAVFVTPYIALEVSKWM